MNGKTAQDGTSRMLRVLIVDDEAGFVDVLRKRLARRGVKVQAAYSGTEAVQAMRRQEFDAAVVDLKMEDMGGIEVLQVFRRMAPETPVIMLTGHGSEEAAREGLKYGAFDYLLKPCDMDALLAKIHEAAGQGGRS
ncbi:MAG: response regulator [Desulfovibrionaceae bacterium]